MQREKRSKNYYDVYSWVKKVIESSKSYDQHQVCIKLTQAFYNSYVKGLYAEEYNDSRFKDYKQLNNLVLEQIRKTI